MSVSKALHTLKSVDHEAKLLAEFDSADVSATAETNNNDADPALVNGEQAEGNPEAAAVAVEPGEEQAIAPATPEDSEPADPSTETTEVEEEGDAEVSKIAGLTPEQKKHYTKVLTGRLSKESEKRKAAEERAEALEAQFNEVKQQLETAQAAKGIAPSPQNPLANVLDASRLEEIENAAQTTAEWADDLIARVAVDASEVEAELKANKIDLPDYSPASLVKFLQEKRRAARGIVTAAPKQRDFLQLRSQTEQLAVQEFPWWKQPKSREVQAAAAMLQKYPALNAIPDVKFWLGHAITNFLKRADEVNARKEAPAKPAAKPAAAPPLAAPRARAAAPVIQGNRVNGKPVTTTAAVNFEKKPSGQALEAKYLAEFGG